MSSCSPNTEYDNQMRRSKSGFFVRTGWTFVGFCKRTWYKIRMRVYFEKPKGHTDDTMHNDKSSHKSN